MASSVIQLQHCSYCGRPTPDGQMGINCHQLLGLLIQYQLLVCLCQVQCAKALATRQGCQDVLWLWDVHFQSCIHGDLEVATDAECPILWGWHYGSSPTINSTMVSTPSRRSNSRASASLIANGTGLGWRNFGWVCSFTDRWIGGVCAVLSSGQNTSPNCRSSFSRFMHPTEWYALDDQLDAGKPTPSKQCRPLTLHNEQSPSPAPRTLPCLCLCTQCLSIPASRLLGAMHPGHIPFLIALTAHVLYKLTSSAIQQGK